MTTSVIGSVVLAVLVHGLRLGTDGRRLWCNGVGVSFPRQAGKPKDESDGEACEGSEHDSVSSPVSSHGTSSATTWEMTGITVEPAAPSRILRYEANSESE